MHPSAEPQGQGPVAPGAGQRHDACPVCQTAARSLPAYFRRAWGEPHHHAATAEAIADALGFCPRHGAELLGREPLWRATAQVFTRAVPLVLPLLTEARFGDEKFQQVYFSAPHACPACAYEHRAVARHAADLGRQAAGPDAAPPGSTLCNAHFQSMARTLKAERRMPALAAHAERLGAAVRAVEDLLHAGLPAATPPLEQPALATALVLAGGAADARGTAVPPPLADALQACSDFEHAVAHPGACAVCVEVERARQRWLAALPLAVAHGLDDWLFLPTCAGHVGLAAGLGDAGITAAAVAHALRVAAEQAHHQLHALVRAAESEAEQAAARIVRWGRRPRRRKSDPPRPPPPKIVRCAACERLAIAELQATGRLLRWLQSGRHRQVFEGGYGLCMKHHAQAYLLSTQGVVRSLLADDQARRLQGLMRWLKAEPDALAQNQPSSAPDAACLLALRRFCGFG